MAISNQAQEISALAELYAYAEGDGWGPLIDSIANLVVFFARERFFQYPKTYFLRRRNRPGKPRFTFSDGSKGELVMTMKVAKGVYMGTDINLKFSATLGDISIETHQGFTYDDLRESIKNAIRDFTKQAMDKALTGGGTPCL